MKKSVLVVHPHVRPHGGGQSVAAWTLEALKDIFDVTLLTWTPVDLDAINRFVGTSLTPSNLKVLLMPDLTRRAVSALLTPSDLFKTAVLQRTCQNVLRRGSFDVALSTHNEVDFGRRGIQYVHFPSSYLPRPDNDWRWYHLRSTVSMYRAFCPLLGRTSQPRLRSNLTLVNSDFIARLVRETHGIDAVTVYPPVPGGFPPVPWEERDDAVACIGRFSREKRWEDAVEVVRRIREFRRPLRLTLIGHSDDPEYEQRLRALAAEHTWFSIRTAVPRVEMVEIVARHRYGIHPMIGEHFGIAPAELQLAGCITFVHRSGGPTETVGGDERLMFDDPGDALRKLQTVLESPALQSELREQGAVRARQFTSDHFVHRIRKIVAEF